MTKEANALSKALGISASEASVLNVALGDIYQSSDAMLTANKTLTKQLLNNEEAFTHLGVATRDQNGNYRNSLEVMLEVNEKLLAFKEGADRNIEGTNGHGNDATPCNEIAMSVSLTPSLSRKRGERSEGGVAGSKSLRVFHVKRSSVSDGRHPRQNHR